MKYHFDKGIVAVVLFCFGVLAPLWAQGESESSDVAVFPQLGHSGLVNAVFPQLGHSGLVNSVAYSPDGRRIVSGAGSIIIWDAESGRELRTLSGHSSSVNSVAYSPDGRRIVSASSDNTVKIWDAESGGELWAFSVHSSYVRSVAWSPDGRRIVLGLGDGTIITWDVEPSGGFRTLTGHSDGVISVAYSPDGRRIVSGSEDNTVKIWDTESGRELRTLSGHSGRVGSVAYSPDGWRIVSGSSDKSVKIWDAASGRELRTLSGHNHEVSSVAYSPDGWRIVSGSWDQTVKIWDAESGREIKNFSGDIARAYNASFSLDGRQILSGGDSIKLWDITTGREIRTFSGHTGGVTATSFSPEGKQILSVADNTIKIWDTANGREIKTLAGVNYASSAVFSPDGKQILSGGRPAQLWDLANGREIRSFPWEANWGLSFVFFGPDGRQAIWGGWGTLELWDITTGHAIRTFLEDTVYMVYSAVFSPDGKFILSGSENSLVQLWDITTGREIRTFSGHTGPVYAISFSPDGRQILSGGDDGTIRLWDMASGREIRTFSGHTNMVGSVAFSPDGKQVISSSSDGTIRQWDISTGKEIAQFISFIDGEWLCLTPDGYYNASPNGDRYLNVRVGNNVYGIDQYRSTFYKPQIVEARLAGNADGRIAGGQTIQNAASFEPPIVVIRSPENGGSFTTGQTELSVSVVDQKQPIKAVKVMVNGRLVGSDELSKLTGGSRGISVVNTGIAVAGNENRVDFRFPINLDPGTNRIEVSASNPYSEGRETVEVTYLTQAAQQQMLPNLWILSIGINRYDARELKNLDYAVNDARDIISAFKSQEGKVYRTVNSLLIADGSPIPPTAENIRDNLSYLHQAGQRDVVLLFIAGHGLNDPNGNFLFMPSDAAFDSGGNVRASRTISHREIYSVLDVPGQKLVFIDSCHSAGGSGGKTRAADNNQLVRELMDNSTVIFTSSRGTELSQESPEFGHGLFTYSIIQGMKGDADLIKDGIVTMKELDTYVSETVPRLTNGAQHPTTNTPDGYVNFSVADVK